VIRSCIISIAIARAPTQSIRFQAQARTAIGAGRRAHGSRFQTARRAVVLAFGRIRMTAGQRQSHTVVTNPITVSLVGLNIETEVAPPTLAALHGHLSGNWPRVIRR